MTMRPKRVDCADCANFSSKKRFPSGLIFEKHHCVLGKRVMFRMKSYPDLVDFECGWPRYCDDFKLKSTTVSDDA